MVDQLNSFEPDEMSMYGFPGKPGR